MDEQQLALVVRAKKGDSAAFGELYEGYANELYRFALYMVGRPEDAEDAVQDAVVSAWQNLPSLRDNAVRINSEAYVLSCELPEELKICCKKSKI